MDGVSASRADAPVVVCERMRLHAHADAQAGAVLVIRINRPQRRNAVDGECARALLAALHAFERDDTAHVAVLVGAGEHFCAGADLQALASSGPSGAHAADASSSQASVKPAGNALDGDAGAGPMGLSRELAGKPVIAAIEGYCVAGGLELALWCDLRVCSRSAKLGVFCRRFGVPLIDGGTVRLPLVVGLGRALDLILTGREVDADEALRIGLVDRVVEPGAALAAACDLARLIASHPSACMRNDRLAVYHAALAGAAACATQPDAQRGASRSGHALVRGNPVRAAMRAEFELGLDTLASSQFVDGVRAFAGGAGRHGQARL